jgi:hypothetical protein
MLIVVFLGCSKKDDPIPVDPSVPASGYIRGYVNGVNWYSNSITTSKSGQTRIVTATQPLPNSQTFSSAILEFRISVNQVGNFGIGEDEPGYVYFVRGYYNLVGKNGNANESYKAYYEDQSVFTITEYDADHLYGSFNFIAHTDDTLHTILFTNGSIQIDY